MKYFRFKPEVIVIVFVEMRIEIGSLDSLDSPDVPLMKHGAFTRASIAQKPSQEA